MLYYPELRKALDAQRRAPPADRDRARGPADRGRPDPGGDLPRAHPPRRSHPSRQPGDSMTVNAGHGSESHSTLPGSNRLASTKLGGQMIKDYWERMFTARERGAHVVWYNGAAAEPDLPGGRHRVVPRRGVLGAAGRDAPRGPGAARRRGVRLHRRAVLLRAHAPRLRRADQAQRQAQSETGIVGLIDQETLASRLPTPDFFVNAYAGCSTGQQWDEISYRIFDKQVPIFKVSYPAPVGQPARRRLPARRGVGATPRATSPSSCSS